MYTAWVVVAVLAVIALFGLTTPTPIPLGPNAGQRLELNGTTLRYVQAGQGPNVLLIHGMVGSAEDWEALVPILARRYRVTAVDLVGMGYSALSPGRHNVAGNAYALRQLAERLQITDVVVVGHSYGGSVALKLASDGWPDARGYVLLAPAASPDVGLIDRWLALPVLGLGTARLVQPFVGENMIRTGLATALPPDEKFVPSDFFAKRLWLWNRPEILHAYAQERVAFQSELHALNQRYAQIAKPVAILQGDRDSYAKLIAASKMLASHIPGAQLVELSGAGHYLQYRHTAAIATEIDRLHVPE